MENLKIPVANVNIQGFADNWLEIIHDNVTSIQGKFVAWFEPQSCHRMDEEKQPILRSVFRSDEEGNAEETEYQMIDNIFVYPCDYPAGKNAEDLPFKKEKSDYERGFVEEYFVTNNEGTESVVFYCIEDPSLHYTILSLHLTQFNHA